MSDRKEIFRLKLAIEEDGKLSHGAARLGLRVCSWIYNHPQHRWQPDEPFPLPWTECSRLLWGICKRQAYHQLRELVDRGHFAYSGILGCPGKAHFRLIIPDATVTGRDAKKCPPSGAENCAPKGAKKRIPRGANCDTPSGAKNSPPRDAQGGSPLISNSLREEISNSNGGNSSAAMPRQGTNQKQQSPAAKRNDELARLAEEHLGKFRKSQRHT